MRTIKEKSIEVFPKHCNANTDISNSKKRIGFNSGANYVLEQIEKAYNKDGLVGVLDMIEQLKK